LDVYQIPFKTPKAPYGREKAPPKISKPLLNQKKLPSGSGNVMFEIEKGSPKEKKGASKLLKAIFELQKGSFQATIM
jgi:hypothetical protein